MDIEIIKSDVSCDDLAISRLEFLVGQKFPHEYREFLLRYNGGYPDPNTFKFNQGSDESCIDRFLGINVGQHSNIETYWEMYKGRVPKGMFPFAHDPGGNLILIGLVGDKMGRIYFWDHEREADESRPDMSNVHLVSNNLSEFLAGLYELVID